MRAVKQVAEAREFPLKPLGMNHIQLFCIAAMIFPRRHIIPRRNTMSLCGDIASANECITDRCKQRE